MKNLILPLLLLSGFASAHTEVTGLSPAPNAVVQAPKTVSLTLSEPVDLHFCTFKVYPLKATGDKLALNRAAADLAKTALNAKGDDAARADTAPKLSGMAAKVSIPLKTNLKAGNYAVMWRILSDDGHVVTGQSVFTVQ